jgi:uncharacterized protein YjeT (DUF2065 family)
MEKTLFLSGIIGPIYLILGLSILLYAKQWKKVIAEYAANHFIMMINMMSALIIGLLILNIYNVWSWSLNVVITITGWCSLLKGAFYFLAPGKWIKTALNCKIFASSGFLYTAGVVLGVIGAMLSYNVYLA